MSQVLGATPGTSSEDTQKAIKVVHVSLVVHSEVYVNEEIAASLNPEHLPSHMQDVRAT